MPVTAMSEPDASPIIVIGAGVLGLSTARLLQDAQPTRQIYIIASELPADSHPSADYASMWAGAHYRPIPGSTAQLKDEAQLAYQTTEVMRKIAETTPEAGVEVLQGTEYLEDPPEANLVLKTGDLYASVDDGFQVIEAGMLPAGVRWGCEYAAWSLNVPVYCAWLLTQFEEIGGRVIRKNLSKAEDAFQIAKDKGIENVITVVNCSGRNFDVDPKTKIIRGQTVLVRNKFNKTITRQNHDGSWSFLIPRPRNGGTIVGGSKEIGDMETNARPETTEKLLQQAVAAFPEFVSSMDDFDVAKINVGRRPWRDGGVRMEIEEFEDGRRIVHGYGAGGRGYELSWGVGQRLVKLVMNGDQASAVSS